MLIVSIFPGGLDDKESACNSGDPVSIPESGRSPGEGNDSPLQYSCLELLCSTYDFLQLCMKMVHYN